MTNYGSDLTYIHDAGFTSFPRDAAPYLLETIGRIPSENRLVVDLGSGGCV